MSQESAASERESEAGEKRLTAAGAVLPALVLAVTFVAYIGTLWFDFVYDDRAQVLQNHLIQSWRFVPRYFVTHVWSDIYKDAPGNLYRPLFLLWLRANHALFGFKPFGWHLTSVLAHLGVTLLVYRMALKFLKDRAAAAIAAMMFGLHPTHIEAVAWVSGVTEPLLALFLLASLLTYLNFRQATERAHRWLATSLLFYVLALLSKETAIILPLLVFAYEWTFRVSPSETSEGPAAEDLRLPRPARAPALGRFKRPLKQVWPYLALTGLYLVVRAMVLKGLGHALTPLPLATLVFTWPSLLWFYAKQLVWPATISPFYDTPYVTSPDFFDFILPAAGVAGAALLLGAWSRPSPKGTESSQHGSRESRIVSFAALWLLLPLIPLMNLSVFPEGEIAHDRYLYLPSVGFSILAAMGWRRLKLGRATILGRPAVEILSAVAVALVFAAATVTQSVYWADDLVLYYRGMSVAPANAVVENNLATLMSERGQHEAVARLCRLTVQRRPNSWRANYNLGYAYYRLGKLAEAEWYLTRAMSLNPADANQYLYLGLTRFKMGRAEEAVPLIRHALELRPDAPGYHFALGVVLESQGELARALEEFSLELVNDPQQNAARAQIAAIEQRMRSSAPKSQSGSKLSEEKTH